MACITILGTDSRLKEAILDQYNGDTNKADIIVNDILLNNVTVQGDNSFQKFLEAKNDVQTYENGEPTIAEFNEWTDYVDHQNKINKKFSTNSFDTTTKEFLELSEGFTVELMNTLFNIKGFTPNDLFEEGAMLKINDRNVFNVTLAKVKSDIKEYGENPERNKMLLDALDQYPEIFFSAYRGYLQTTFQVNLDVDAILSDAIETSDTKETKDSAFNKSANEFDQKGSAPNGIKILIAGLPDMNKDGQAVPNDLGLIPSVDYDSTFNSIQQALVEVPGDMNLMLQALATKAQFVPPLTKLAERLNFGKDSYTPASKPETYAKEQLLRTQFVNQFNKSRNEYTLHIKNEDGSISVINANLDKVENIILKEWENNLKEILSKNPNAYKDLKKLKVKGKRAVLEALGIEMDNYTLVPSTVFQAIKDYGLESEESFRTIFSPKEGEGVKARLRNIATIKAKNSNDNVDFQHFNAEGKIIYGITLNTYLSSLAKDLRFYSGTDQLKILYPEIFEADYNQSSDWLSKILAGNKINVGAFDGFISKSDRGAAKTSKDLKAKDLNVQRITGMLMEGKYPFLRSADRTTENYFYFEETFRGQTDLIVDGRDAMQNYLASHLEDEIAAMSNKNVNIVHYDKNNKDFRAFHINKNGKKKSLLEEFNPKITTIKNKIAKNSTAALRQELSDEMEKGLNKIKAEEDLWQNEKVVSFIQTMMDQMVEIEKAQLEDNGVLEMDKLEYKHIGEAVEKYGSIESVIDLFALNSFASAIEQTKVFAGDLAFYKNPSDIFKRMSMLNSTKESARTDAEMNRYLNSLDHKFSHRTRVTDSRIKTVTINDVMSKASDYSGAFDTMLQDVFGKDYKRYSKVYNDINEADGFAYMTYDEYRIASERFGEWLPSDEALYNRIAAGEKNLIPEVMRRATVKKYQYTGKLVGPTAVNAIAGRKFAIMPLIPGAIPVGSVLEELNTEMLANNVGMAFYESAAKFGHSIFENEDGNVGAHSMYDSNGKFQLDLSDNYDILDYKYMGNQLKINNDPKENITASTQKRKLVIGNFYKNGELVNPELKDLLNTYNDLQAEMVQDEYDAMAEQDTIDALINVGLEMGYTSNELKSLHFLKELPIVDALPNKQRLEALIMARLSNKVISNKRKGDSVAQVPDVGFEINDESAAIAERHNLQFYRKSEDGKRLLPMEIMIALPTELIDYVKEHYGDGVLSSQALDEFNDAIAKDNALFEKTGEYTMLDRLTTYVGYRVPNQAASSSDVAKVKKFLPPYLGAAVVVPKQIVAKTGSDFDIDKLNLYKPHFTVKYTNEKSIQKDFMRSQIGKNELPALLSFYDITPESDSIGDMNKAFIEGILESEEDLGKKASKFRLIYSMMLREKGIAESLSYDKGSKESKKNKQNLLLETEIDITLHNANWKQLLAPITDGVILDIVKKIRELRGEPAVKTDHISDVFTNAKNIEKFIAFLSGKGGVGQVAVHITNHVLAQKAGLKQVALHNYFGLGNSTAQEALNNKELKDGQVVYDKAGTKFIFRGIREAGKVGAGSPRLERTDNSGEIAIPGANIKLYSQPKQKTSQGLIELGGIENQSGQQISEILSELLTSYVDIAKDPYILDLNALQSTVNTVLMMTRWGMKPETIFLFMNQPIIVDYVKAQGLNESVVTDNSNGRVSKSILIDKTMNKYGSAPNENETLWWTEQQIADGNKKIKRLGKIYKDVTPTQMRTNIKAGNKAKNQAQMLDMFLEYQRQSVIFQKMISSTSPDTKGFKGISVLESQVQEQEAVRETEMFVNYDKMFDSFVGSYQSVKEKYFDKVKSFFIAQNPLYKTELDKLKTFISDNTYGAESTAKALSLIDNEFVRFIAGRGGKINFLKGFDNLFKGEKSIPKTLQKMQKWYEENDVDNVFLQQILPLINNEDKGFDSLKFKGKRLTTIQKETLASGFKALKEADESGWIEHEFGVKDFYRSMIAYQMIQSGIGQSPFSIMEAIPAEDYFAFMKDEITKYSNSDIGVTEFSGHDASEIGEFLLHNPALLYNRFKLPFLVEWSVPKQKYIVTMYGEKSSQNFSLEQMGDGRFYAAYGSYPKIISAPKAAISKYKELKEIADATNYKYQLSNGEVTEIRPELEQQLTALLKSIGADVQYVDQITDRNGDVINAYGRADLVNQVIQLTKGRDISTLPEEAAHIITGMLGKNHPLMKQMMSKIHDFPIYEGVLSEYADVYQSEEDFRFEAVGKLIAEHLVNGTNIGNTQAKAFVENWWNRLVRKLSELFFGKDTSKLQSEMDIFAIVADKIASGQIAEDIANAKESNVDRRTRRVSKQFKMNDKGIMPESISVEELEAAIVEAKIPNITVHKIQAGYTLHKNGVKTNPIQEYYQLRQGPSQQSLVDAFVRDDKRKGQGFILDAQGRERYIVDGVMLPGRVSDKSSAKFAENKSKAEIEKWNNRRESVVSSGMGTYLHAVSQDTFDNAIDSNAPEFANISRAKGTTRDVLDSKPVITFPDGSTEAITPLTTKEKNVIAGSVSYLASHINEVQKGIKADGKAIIRLENFVIGENGKTGGSQDVTVVYSDGSVSIYDYKNVSTLQRNAQNKIEDDTTIQSYKLESYNMQIGTYMKILREDYGVTKFRDTRILPFAVQYQQTKKGKTLPAIANIEGFTNEGKKEYLMPIPVVKELGENPILNKILNVLFKRQTTLEKDLITNWGNVAQRDIISNELKTLKKSITSIQVNSDVAPLISSVEDAVTHISDITGNSTFTTDNIGDLNKLLLEVKLFNSIFIHAQDSIKNNPELLKKFDEVNRRIASAEVVLAGKLTEILEETYGKEISAPQEELGQLESLFNNFSQINQPVFEAGRALVKKATGDTNREIQEFVGKVDLEVADLKKWASSKGMSLMDAYKKITVQEGDMAGNLIGKQSKEFYTQKKEALKEKDVAWLQKNFTITAEGKALFKEDLEIFKSSLKKGSKLNASRTKQWILRNDLSNSKVAWSNRYALNRYTEIKNEEQTYSEQYKDLLSPANAGLKKYYDFYIQANRKFNEDLAGHDVIGPYFVANVRKDMIDSVAQGDGIVASGKNAAKDFVAGLRVRQNDVQLVEGEDTVIPLLYKDNFKYKDADGKWVTDIAAKNADLTNNLILFSESVFRKKNMLKIVDITESLKMHIAEQEVIKTGITGKVILNQDGTVKTGVSTTNADLFNTLTTGLVYGKRIQNKDKEFGMFGQQLSMNKSLQTAMSYMSTKSLAFNYVSGFGNAAAGMINAKIKSKGGLYYNSSQMNKSLAMITTRSKNDIANQMSNYFNVEKDHWVQESAARLSASKLTKALTFDKWYILQQKGDEMIANTILMSMLQNYGLDSNGNIERLAKLPEGSKSLLEKVDRSNDKIEIEGLSTEAFDDFRNRVKYISRQVKGTNTTEDLSKVGTDVRMKAFMHFRNWIQPMVKERFGSLVYTQEVQEFEYGRYNSAIRTVVGDGFKAVPKLMLDIVTLGKIKYKGDTELLTGQYEKFKKDNPHLVGTKQMPSIDEYLEMRERSLREGLYELKWVVGLAMVLLAAGGDWDDDGTADYKQTAVGRVGYKLLERMYLELSFFSNPASVKELLKSPLPVMQVTEDIQNVFGNTFSEAGDIITGSTERDQTPIGHYSKKMLPLLKVGFDLLEDIDFNFDDDE